MEKFLALFTYDTNQVICGHRLALIFRTIGRVMSVASALAPSFARKPAGLAVAVNGHFQ